MTKPRKYCLTAKNIEVCCMRIPMGGWLSIPHNGGVNGKEIDDFTAWLHTLDTKFEWEEAGLKFIDEETGTVRHLKCGELLCQLHDENGSEVILNLDDYILKCLFSSHSS